MRISATCSITVAAVLVACASSNQDGPAEMVVAGTNGPELVGCPGYTAPQTPWTFDNRVWVEVVVQPDGSVEPSSAQRVHSRYNRGDQAAVQRAVDLAGTCTFRPVESRQRTTIQFAFN